MITESVTHFMAKEMIPISTVEKPGFLTMVKKLDLQYEVPLRKYYSKTVLPSLYAETREQIYILYLKTRCCKRYTLNIMYSKTYKLSSIRN